MLWVYNLIFSWLWASIWESWNTFFPLTIYKRNDKKSEQSLTHICLSFLPSQKNASQRRNIFITHLDASRLPCPRAKLPLQPALPQRNWQRRCWGVWIHPVWVCSLIHWHLSMLCRKRKALFLSKGDTKSNEVLKKCCNPGKDLIISCISVTWNILITRSQTSITLHSYSESHLSTPGHWLTKATKSKVNT